jgi:hypothetical protein
VTPAEVFLTRLESLGAKLVLRPGGADLFAFPGRGEEADRVVAEIRASGQREAVLEILRRRRAERRDRVLRDLAGRWCSACGFSCWAVTDRGEASCYGCRLLARGITPACARCKRREWRLQDARKVCVYCAAVARAGGDSRAAAPPPIARPGESSREVSGPGGAA